MTIAAVLGSKGNDVVTVASSAPVADAVGLLAEHRIGALPVVNDGQLEGIMSERDVVYCIRAHGREVLDWPVSRVMTKSVITAEASTPVLAALALMTQRRVRHLPVLEGGKLRGIVSIGDLVKHRMERIEAEAEAMRAYIQSA
jgi:CBS domain-containing protein